MIALELVPSRSALVTIDLQTFTRDLAVVPNSAAAVIARTGEVARAVRNAGGLVVHVLASLGVGGGIAVARPPSSDTPPFDRQLPDGWDRIAAELGPAASDVLIVKWGWDAFHGTDLDLQLRRRGIDTIALAGVATNIGIESTARSAYERGYCQLFAADLLSAFSDEEHTVTVNHVLRRLGHVGTSGDLLHAFGGADLPPILPGSHRIDTDGT